MVSKLEALRRGDVVELSSGEKARLNPKNKTMELSSGRVIRVGDDPDYFPRDEREAKSSVETQKLEREISKFPLGQTAGEFAYQFGQKGAITGGIGDWYDRLSNTGEDYLAKRQAKQRVSGRISEESPYLSGGATVASFVPDLVATRGMSAMKAAPILTGIGAGSRVIDEPGEVIGEAALAAGGGYLIDKGGQFLSRIAKRRGQARQIAREAEEVGARNVAGAAEAEAENLAQRQAFQKEQEFAQRQGQAQQHQYNLEKVARENEVQQARQAYEQAKAANSTETQALKQEYQEAQRRYKDALAALPEEQRAAQRQFSEGINQEIADVERSIPKGTKIPTDELKVWDFYNNYIQQNGLIGTAEARQMQKVFRNLFPNGRNFTPSQFADKLRSVESAMVAGNDIERAMLSEFKEYLGQNTAQTIQNSVLANEFKGGFFGTLKNDLSESLSSIKPQNVGARSSGELVSESERAIKQYINELSPSQLAKKVNKPGFAREVAEKAIPKDRFLNPNYGAEELAALKKNGLLKYVEEGLEKEYEQAINQLTQKIENQIAAAELQATGKATEVGADISGRMGKTYGMAEPVPTPTAPVEPSYPNAPLPPELPPQPVPPAPMGSPSAPIPQTFTPEPVPTLPGAQGAMDTLADTLERPMSDLMKGKYDLGPVGNIAKLKYLAGPKTAPIVGGYAALKGLTSPTATGQAMRAAYRDLGVAAIEQWAQKYPSYHDGILDDPRERRSLVREIEDDDSIPLEAKALIQSQINRGKSLESKMQ